MPSLFQNEMWTKILMAAAVAWIVGGWTSDPINSVGGKLSFGREGQFAAENAQLDSTNKGTEWRLVRTPDTRTGREIVSIMTVANPALSDLDVAGLMLGCSDDFPDLMIILIQPLPPREQPIVRLLAGSTSVQFKASVVPPGLSLKLPPNSSTSLLAIADLRKELTVEVDSGGRTFRGVFSLSGLRPAFVTLKNICRF